MGLESSLTEHSLVDLQAAVVVLIRNGLVLATSRRGIPDDINLPGGAIEPGETAREAAARELAEETSVVVACPFLELVPIFDRYAGSSICRVFLFDGDVSSVEPRKMEEGIEVVWATVERMCDVRNTFHEFNRHLFTMRGLR